MKFIEICRVNRNRPAGWYLWNELFGWLDYQHCDCEVCLKKRNEENLYRCTKEFRCNPCIRKEERHANSR